VLIASVPAVDDAERGQYGRPAISVFDGTARQVVADPLAVGLKELSMPSTATSPGYAVVRQGARVRNSFWIQGMDGGFPCRLFLHKGIFGDRSERKDLKNSCAKASSIQGRATIRS